ncbi:TPA: rod shape-determining protein MreB [Vibrio parahaemolyticus]|uniref:GRAS family protein n=1 Tax=Vibrio parahaemolyticus TaxID=670 RepID=UPI000B3037EE|nr:GRAS family protein [Vibrio parahaemolyticus]ELY5142042.1 hypothetical protein [Vibrio vulnificus]MBE4468300.1 GRAS family protein [Vibrio parahaemolyticus]MBE4468307.1 GRAS family protein [Vibrio parahaemolyticus]MDF4257142.1 rod shape-determining protein MreB [Vibrio parahaemolyticus]MDF4262376.1 rod shape-determining protein MreB [Vibrio parahaemolyticus]
MFDLINKFLQQSDLLIELGKDQIQIKSFSSDIVFQDSPYIAVETTGEGQTIKAIGSKAKLLSSNSVEVSNPFESIALERIDTYRGKRVMELFIFEMHKLTKFRLSPRIVVHPQELSGCMSQEFVKTLLQLVTEVGARDVVVYEGSRIDHLTESFKSVKNRCSAT